VAGGERQSRTQERNVGVTPYQYSEPSSLDSAALPFPCLQVLRSKRHASVRQRTLNPIVSIPSIDMKDGITRV